jgi:hypothetical protein
MNASACIGGRIIFVLLVQKSVFRKVGVVKFYVSYPFFVEKVTYGTELGY